MLNLFYNEEGLRKGALSFEKADFSRFFKADPALISIVPYFSADRLEVESFIKNIYAESYGAKIEIHYPVLMSVRDKTGTILAAVGFRPATVDPLFLEQYLEIPIEQTLSTPRGQIVEIGNLASAGGGASLFLFMALSAYLDHRGYTKGVITATRTIRKRLVNLGLNIETIGEADPERLGEEKEKWGSYYDTEPHVFVGDVHESYHILKKYFGAEYKESRPRLYPRLHYKTGEIKNAL